MDPRYIHKSYVLEAIRLFRWNGWRYSEHHDIARCPATILINVLKARGIMSQLLNLSLTSLPLNSS